MSTTPTQGPAQSEDVMQRFEELLDDLKRRSAEFFTCGEAEYADAHAKAESSIVTLRDFVSALARDKQRVDWMEDHGASVEVSDNETLSCAVQASDDYKLSGSADPYNFRKAIDAAMKGTK